MSDKNYVISEEYILPSNGKIYSQKVNPVVRLRSMTTNDEMKRLAPSERPYKNLCDIIDDCLIDDPGISSYDMCLADYQYLLHKLRVVTYGADYKLEFQCPWCLTTETATLNLDELEVVTAENIDIESLLHFDLPVTHKHIALRMQTPRIIDDITIQEKEFERKSKGSQGDSAFLFTLIATIESVDGDKLDYIQKEKFIRDLPMKDTNYITKKAQKLVDAFGIDTIIHRTCPKCGVDYAGSFRLTKEFFGPSIDE